MTEACAHCKDPLTLEIEVDEDDADVNAATSSATAPLTKTVPDDVSLPCGCHFHWYEKETNQRLIPIAEYRRQCLLDSYHLTSCPSCSRDISSTSSAGAQQILCSMHNEGGLQENLDILPLLTEESYLRAYPEQRICRAFLEFCREGDVAAIVDLLKSCEEDDDDEDEEMEDEPRGPKKTADEILRYQDPIGDMQSALHAAIAGNSREVAWLLLLLASQYPESEFPALVYQEAANLGIMRTEQEGKVDIRSLKDAQGRTADQMAAEIDGVWHGWPGSGRLAI